MQGRGRLSPTLNGSCFDTAVPALPPSPRRKRVEIMKSAVAWNVKGVGPEARETAREAARRAGLSVGEWLDSVIIESAGEEAQEEEHGHSEAQGFSAIHERLDALASRLGRMGSAAKARPADRRGSDVAANLREAIARG